MRPSVLLAVALGVLRPAPANADCSFIKVMQVKVDCEGPEAPADCGTRVAAMQESCERARDTPDPADGSVRTVMRPADAAKLLVQLKDIQAHLAQASAPPAAQVEHSPATDAHAPPDHKGSAQPFHPEQTQKAVDQALTNGDTKLASQNAQKFFDNGDMKGGRAAVDRILAQDRSNPQALGLRAQSKLAGGDVSGALQDATAALKGEPDNQTARQIQAWAESQGRDIHLRKGLALDFGARGETERGAGGGGAGDARQIGGAGAAVAGQSKAPAVVFSQVGGPAAEALAEARRYAALGDYARAQTEISRALAFNAKNAEALALRSKFDNGHNDFEGAIRDAGAALSLDPKNVAALLERGFAQYSLGRYKEALADVEQALAIDPLNAMGHLYHAMILEKMDRAKEAISEYIKAAELDASLKPIVDEALARLGFSSTSAAGRAARRYWPVWAAALLVAFALLAFGLKRVVRPDWATPVTPIR